MFVLTQVSESPAPEYGEGPNGNLLYQRLLRLDPQWTHHKILDPVAESAHLHMPEIYRKIILETRVDSTFLEKREQ